MNRQITEKKKTKIFWPILWISLLVGFIVGIYGPLSVFFSNIDDFSFDFFDLLPYLLIITAVCFVASFLILKASLKINQKLCNLFLLLAATLAAAFVLQGSFFSSWIPEMTGDDIDWSVFSGWRVASVCLWIGLPCLVLLTAVLLKKHSRFGIPAGVCVFAKILTAYLCLTLILTAFTTAGNFRRKTGTRISTEHMLEMSQERNFIVLLLDCIDSYSFSVVLGESAEYDHVFDDFTYYRNATGSYNLTSHAVPFILTGKWYENGEPYVDYIEREVPSSSLFLTLQDAGYRLGMYDESIGAANFAPGLFENVFEADGFSYPVRFVKMMLKLTGLKYLPFRLKPYCTATPTDIYYDTLKGDPSEPCFSWENREFYDTLHENGITLTNDSACFKFIHLKGGHGPWQLDKNLELVEKSSYREGIAGSIFLTDKYLSLLKESGVYDNSVIIIMADHGANLINEVNRSNPILLIKGIDERHDFLISDTPVSHADLPEAYTALLNSIPGTKLFHEGKYDDTGRRYIMCNSNDSLTECLQTGYADCIETFIETGITYPAF